MKSTLLFSIVALLLLPGAQVRKPGPGKPAVAATEGQADYFRKMKPRFKYVNRKRFSNEEMGRDNNLKLERMDSLTYRKLFRKSRIFHVSDKDQGAASYYAYNERPGYYQLVFAGNGRYVSDLVLFHFAPDGRLLAEQTVSCFFVDAGLAEVTKSYLRGDSLLIRAELNLGEAPAGTPCDSLVTVFKIARNGAMNQVSKKMFKIKCR
jgi:hypothetical protein